MAAEKRGSDSGADGRARSQRDLEILAEVGRSLLGVTDLDDHLGLTLRLAVDALEADRGSVMMSDDPAGGLQIRAAQGLPQEAMNAVSKFGEGIAGWVAEHSEPVVLHGGVDDSRFEGKDPTIGSSLSLPLHANGKMLGVLNIVRLSGDKFTDEDLRLASSLADMASLAIEKSSLHNELKQRESRVSDLLAAAIGAQERERTRIAADIHDGFLQDLSALFLKAENIRMELRRGMHDKADAAVVEMQEMLRNEVNALRDYIFEVRPPSLDEVGLAPTLEAMVERIGLENKLDCRFEDRFGNDRLSKAVETIFYRTAQEALRNVAKHANAGLVEVTLELKGQEAILSISDNGTGIEPGTLETRSRNHFGIDTMRERVELAGGHFYIGPSSPTGTIVMARIPAEMAIRA